MIELSVYLFAYTTIMVYGQCSQQIHYGDG